MLEICSCFHYLFLPSTVGAGGPAGVTVLLKFKTSCLDFGSDQAASFLDLLVLVTPNLLLFCLGRRGVEQQAVVASGLNLDTEE
jgi:hypothetical protein